MTKKELRRTMKARNLSFGAEARSVASARIFGRVGELPAFAAAHTVALFSALPDEPDTGEWRRGGVRRGSGWSCRASRATPCASATAIRRRCGAGRSASPSRSRGADVSARGDRPRGGSRGGLHGRGCPVGTREGVLRPLSFAGGVPRGDGRGLLCAPTGRGAALRTARRGGGLRRGGVRRRGSRHEACTVWPAVRSASGTLRQEVPDRGPDRGVPAGAERKNNR